MHPDDYLIHFNLAIAQSRYANHELTRSDHTRSDIHHAVTMLEYGSIYVDVGSKG